MEEYKQINEIIPNRLYLTSYEGAKNKTKVLDLKIDIIVTILHWNPKLNKCKQYSNIECIYYECKED